MSAIFGRTVLGIALFMSLSNCSGQAGPPPPAEDKISQLERRYRQAIDCAGLMKTTSAVYRASAAASSVNPADREAKLLFERNSDLRTQDSERFRAMAVAAKAELDAAHYLEHTDVAGQIDQKDAQLMSEFGPAAQEPSVALTRLEPQISVCDRLAPR